MPTAPPAWPPLDAAFLAASAATYGFTLGRPSVLAILPDGAVLYRRTPPRAFVSDLFLFEGGRERCLVRVDELLGGGSEALSAEEKARRERSRTATRGVVDVSVSADGARLLVPLGERLFLVDRTDGAARELDPGPGYPMEARLSPDGARVAFVREGDLWVLDVDGGPARRLTRHPEGAIHYGTAEFVAQEELHRDRGWWWGPDGASIVFQRTDETPVDVLYVADARHPEVVPTPFRYPRAGRPNAVVDLGVVPVTGGEPRFHTWDVAAFPYLGAVSVGEAGTLLLQVLDRDQTRLVLLALDLATGTFRTLLEEEDPAWINLAPGNATWVGDGFLWMSERHGEWTLARHAADGRRVAPLTRAGLGLRAILGLVDDDVVLLAGADAREAQVVRVPLSGGTPRVVEGSPGVSTAFVEADRMVVVTAHADGGVTTALVDDAGRRRELPSVAEEPPWAATTTLESVEVDGRVHHVAITRPRTFDPALRLPVLLKVYGGPHVKTVLRAQDTYRMDQWYADAGFVVVRVDGRGTPDRGREWERAVLRDLLTVPLDDQVGALRAVAERHAELDLDRVGVFGWSFGGYLAAMACLLRPDVFRAGVAGAPVTDWALYDTAYTERYMKTPAANPEGYRSTSALTHAARLTRPLLVLHGLTDDNVHFAHTVAFVQELYLAGKRVELVPLSATHMVPDPRLGLAREQAQVDFFRAHLGAEAG